MRCVTRNAPRGAYETARPGIMGWHDPNLVGHLTRSSGLLNRFND